MAMSKSEAVQIVSEAANVLLPDYQSAFIGEPERNWSAFLGEMIVELLTYAKSGDPNAPTTREGWVNLVEAWALAKVNCW